MVIGSKKHFLFNNNNNNNNNKIINNRVGYQYHCLKTHCLFLKW